MKRILIVDDEKDVNLSSRLVLESNGFQVDSFDDPLLALENFKPNSYDLVILDIKMPKMNRFKLYGELKKKDLIELITRLLQISQITEIIIIILDTLILFAFVTIEYWVFFSFLIKWECR